MTRLDQNGSCHCGSVAYTVSLEVKPSSFRCNCSICTKSRAWLTTVPERDFRLLRGQSAISVYTFGSGSIEHCFCKNCGVKTHGRGEAAELGGRFIAVNVATLNLSPEELAEVHVTYLNGRDDEFDSAPAVTSYL